MKRLTIGIVDYDTGNLASVKQSLQSMGYRSRIARDQETLDLTDLLLLPGVGAFPAAMRSLHAHGLAQYLIEKARQGKPVIGICLGMQLLADCSHEIELTSGLGLIPGEVIPLPDADWHIGWNSIEMQTADPMFTCGDGRAVYFNHSYAVHCPQEYRVGVTRINHTSDPFVVATRRNNVVGLQFHPEKSQAAGRALLASVIEGLCHA